MKRTTTATGLLTLLAMLVLGAFSVGAASAHDFSWTGPLPGLVLVLSDNPQVFEAAAGLTVTCQHFGAHGLASNGNLMTIKTIKVTGQYSSCKATGGLGATVTTAEFEISAEESVAVVGKPIVITILAAGCSLKINNGPPNNNLSKILYLNQPGGDLLAHVEIGKITSLGSAEPCGVAGVEKTEGTYRGLLLAKIDGGTLRWS
jgi:hypothetical protein